MHNTPAIARALEKVKLSTFTAKTHASAMTHPHKMKLQDLK